MSRREPSPAETVAAMIAALHGAGMGPSQIAREAGLSRQSIYRLEQGMSARPSAETYQRIERAWLDRGCPPPPRRG